MLVHDFLELSAKRFPDKIALVDDYQKLTYKQIDSSAERFASVLIKMGVIRQSRVLILLDNTAEAVISIFGALKAGCIFIILNHRIKARKLNYILKDSGASVLIANTNARKLIEGAVDDCNGIQHIVWCKDNEKVNLPDFDGMSLSIQSHDWKSIISDTPIVENNKYHKIIDIDLATIIYTSGSTGEPKGVVSAHYNIVAAATSITQYLETEENDIIFNVLPLSFDYGLYQVLMTFLVGGTIVLEKSFAYTHKIIEKIVNESITGLPVVPTMVASLSQIDNIGKYDFSCVKYITNTSSAMPKSYIKFLQSTFKNAKIYLMYGLTECKRVSYLPPEYVNIKPDSVGIPIPNEEVFIYNENGNEVEDGEIGELVVRGSNVMQGYWNADEETKKRFKFGRYRCDTVLYTGDLFRRDEEGFLYFIDRKDDMMKVKDTRISPQEIENILYEIPDVVEAAIISIYDKLEVNAIKAVMVLKNNSSLTKSEIFAYCNQNLERIMVPKYIEFRSSLPKTFNGKIDRKAVRKLI